MTEAVAEMLTAIVDRNGLSEQDIVSVLFTSTPDLVCGFPASAARTIGFRDIPLMCAQEISVSGALPRVVRVMVLVETDRSRADVEHVFLRGAQVLREDLNR
ncbi:MAG: chorismate mutase [Actinomycetes bacterium]|jgi:chorismate mutase